MRRKRPRSCGKVGRRSRGILRDLVQEREIEIEKARKAISHVEECGYCNFSIELAIQRAKEGRKTSYLGSVGETLQEARRLAGISRISRERSLG